MSPFLWTAVAVVTVFSAARITRLLTVDHFPPIAYIREGYLNWTDKRDWTRGYGLLGICAYCMGFWVALGVVLWGWLADFDTPWWIVNSIFAAAYAAAFVVRFDGDDS